MSDAMQTESTEHDEQSPHQSLALGGKVEGHFAQGQTPAALAGGREELGREQEEEGAVGGQDLTLHSPGRGQDTRTGSSALRGVWKAGVSEREQRYPGTLQQRRSTERDSPIQQQTQHSDQRYNQTSHHDGDEGTRSRGHPNQTRGKQGEIQEDRELEEQHTTMCINQVQDQYAAGQQEQGSEHARVQAQCQKESEGQSNNSCDFGTPTREHQFKKSQNNAQQNGKTQNDTQQHTRASSKAQEVTREQCKTQRYAGAQPQKLQDARLQIENHGVTEKQLGEQQRKRGGNQIRNQQSTGVEQVPQSLTRNQPQLCHENQQLAVGNQLQSLRNQQPESPARNQELPQDNQQPAAGIEQPQIGNQPPQAPGGNQVPEARHQQQPDGYQQGPDGERQPSDENQQAQAGNQQPAVEVLNMQVPVGNQQPPPGNPNHHRAGNQPQPAGNQPQPDGNQPQPAGNQPQPAGIRQQPAGNQPQPAENQPQPAENQPQPAGIQQQPAGNQPQLAGNQPQPAGNQPQPARNQPQPAGNQPQPAGNQQPAAIQYPPAGNQPAAGNQPQQPAGQPVAAGQLNGGHVPGAPIGLANPHQPIIHLHHHHNPAVHAQQHIVHAQVHHQVQHQLLVGPNQIPVTVRVTQRRKQTTSRGTGKCCNWNSPT